MSRMQFGEQLLEREAYPPPSRKELVLKQKMVDSVFEAQFGIMLGGDGRIMKEGLQQS